MNTRERRAVIAGICIVAGGASLRTGIALFEAYDREVEQARASATSSSQALQLVGSTNSMRRLLREIHIRRSTQRTLLTAVNRAAAATELAQLVMTLVQDDSLAALTITPESDSTVLGRFRRIALRLRFEAGTESLVQFLTAVVTSAPVIRIDGLKVAALQGASDEGWSQTQIDARISAWFKEDGP
ncbi:MAG: GspMb/PilO family protein [Gemmatimonadaceae bacterium]